MRHRLLYLALTLATAVPTGCDEPINCTAELVSSVQLSVVDAETGEEVDAMVTFQLDGAAPRTAEELSPGRYMMGEEEEGSFEVTVTADGYQPAMATYEVTADECHVMMVEDTIELTRTP